MAVINFPQPGRPLNVPESLSIYSLLMAGKSWARCGTVEMGGFFHHEVLVFTEMQAEVHMYQKGHGEHDHLLFWTSSSEHAEGADDHLIAAMFHGGWTEEPPLPWGGAN